ncbi:unnamed protein product [Aphanomyces euteiches]|uniref:WSC domain-containing protein n=1 Tax=Aphanomyces euteiches TaxID=100861 RepID=A0A6G0XSJ7_9STRA|nr:hypothetical protein Ae201684_001734 [Aphanomyces euteiches]KAF0743591.1 hypothetical protein Ae201684_001735 [Aphanomyces euteiches]KAH9075497.1 hypothetical protein Ae201684P_004176 [Aphanomyces euteiches]KAH9150102.1 hypothetical protein AeRB84_007003 [Aphanomyces euteiches]
MKFTALLAASLVVLSVLAEEYDWQTLVGGNAIAGRKSLASFNNTEVLQDCRKKCEGVDGTIGISHSGYFKSCECLAQVYTYNPVWSKAVDLKATALLNAANCVYSAQGDVKKYDVVDFQGTYDDCLTKCPREGNSFVWTRGPLGDMLRPTGEDGHCYCKQVPSTFDTKTLVADASNALVFCQFNPPQC